MHEYPLIADHGLIGDLQTSALVATDGSIDWFCAPRFDSPSLFAALLDHADGGRFQIRPTIEVFTSKQLYLPDTAILVTRFMTEAGVGEVVDFMPVTGTEATDRHRIVRMIHCVRGEMTFAIDLAPRFDYGREPHETLLNEDGVVFTGRKTSMTVNLVREPADARLARADVDDHGDLHAEFTLTAGQVRGVVVESGFAGPARQFRVAEVEQLLRETSAFWEGWLSGSTYTGRWREQLYRSAITLKLMTYAPSGGLVAAPTAALPEQVGGERNWDYRYTWIRDASFSVYALLGLGYTDEAAAFGSWLRDRIRDQAGEGSGPLKIMYRVDGSSDLEEEVLHHLEGYRGSRPVRIGNGAADQLQLDIYGEAMDSIYHADTHGLQVGHEFWSRLADVIEWLCENWNQPEEGIWETRGGRQEFTYGRLMSWVALDRAVRLARDRARPADLARWIAERDRIYKEIMERGWNTKREAFVQNYANEGLDASLLMMPLMGFVAPRDPMWLSTLRAMDQELVSDSLVYRYDPNASPDGLRGTEGTFSICTFWYVDALARSGRLEDARLTLEKMSTYANHLGLYSEEIGLTGEQLGNFPQAFSHLAHINAALNLDFQLDHGAGWVEPVLSAGRGGS